MKPNDAILIASICLSAFVPAAGVALFCYWVWRLENRKA